MTEHFVACNSLIPRRLDTVYYPLHKKLDESVIEFNDIGYNVLLNSYSANKFIPYFVSRLQHCMNKVSVPETEIVQAQMIETGTHQ
ncbi:hypothetical protein SADUNF_Sadunf02G0091400 [Salix dunnii]|uniref:Uncharacterized protein n=1 Tax=Salix dunnii TaxID=1413687 RepID=A0A835N773_9ROSI|nr:hypothetical protein SADUNF_Sadunf02G0091400 [Salix dunnii]